MPPSIHHAILKEQHRVMDNNPMGLIDEDDHDQASYLPPAMNPSYLSSSSLPPAFNPDFVASPEQAENCSETAQAQVQQRTVESVISNDPNEYVSAKASAPVSMETVDPFIAAVFQCGFSDDNNKKNNQQEAIVIDDDDDEDDDVPPKQDDNNLSPRSFLDEQIMMAKTMVSPDDRLVQKFVHGPSRKSKADETSGSSIDTMEPTTTTDSTTSARKNASIALIPAVTGHVAPGTKADPPSAPRFILLTHHRSHYERLGPYALPLLAWRTQQRSRAALERCLNMKQRHFPTVKRAVKKSAKFLKRASQKTLSMAIHHGPIVGHQIKRLSTQTVKTIKELESKHQLLAKSKEGISDVWSRQTGSRASF